MANIIIEAYQFKSGRSLHIAYDLLRKSDRWDALNALRLQSLGAENYEKQIDEKVSEE